jgi:hypothetical protein
MEVITLLLIGVMEACYGISTLTPLNCRHRQSRIRDPDRNNGAACVIYFRFGVTSLCVTNAHGELTHLLTDEGL